VLLGWFLAVVAIIGLAQWAGSRLDNNFALGSSPSQQAQNLLASRFPSQEGDSADVVLHSSSPLDSPANAAIIAQLARSMRPLADVSGVQSPLGPGTASRQLSPDRRIGFVVVQFDATAADLPATAVKEVIDTATRFARPGLQVALGGAPVEQVVSAAPGSSEGIGLLAAIVVMLLAFGSVVAVLSHLITVPTFGPDIMIMVGLGVGIDYALFVVTRYRQALAQQHPPRDATIVALSTAGRAVLFAGGTVVIALLGLFVVGLPFMDGLAAATIVAVGLVLTAALTLLPAIFGFAGTAIDRLHIPGLLARPGARPGAKTGRGFWIRWSETVQKLHGSAQRRRLLCWPCWRCRSSRCA
jgi:putative drug exporter of the RND superfamily